MLKFLNTAGFKVTTGQRTVFGQDDHFSEQIFSWLVICTGQVHGFQINNSKNKIQEITKTVISFKIFYLLAVTKFGEYSTCTLSRVGYILRLCECHLAKILLLF